VPRFVDAGFSIICTSRFFIRLLCACLLTTYFKGGVVAPLVVCLMLTAMVAGQTVETHNDMYCSQYDYYQDYYPQQPELCPAHAQLCTVHGEYGKMLQFYHTMQLGHLYYLTC
jgi:hypothetical protein